MRLAGAPVTMVTAASTPHSTRTHPATSEKNWANREAFCKLPTTFGVDMLVSMSRDAVERMIDVLKVMFGG